MTTRAKRTPPPLADADRAAVARLILDDYRRFLSDPDADSKAFAARHAAGKAALAHLDQLMKVGGRARRRRPAPEKRRRTAT